MSREWEYKAECKNIQANDTYDERLLPKIHRKFLNLYNKKILKI